MSNLVQVLPAVCYSAKSRVRPPNSDSVVVGLSCYKFLNVVENCLYIQDDWRSASLFIYGLIDAFGSSTFT